MGFTAKGNVARDKNGFSVSPVGLFFLASADLLSALSFLFAMQRKQQTNVTAPLGHVATVANVVRSAAYRRECGGGAWDPSQLIVGKRRAAARHGLLSSDSHFQVSRGRGCFALDWTGTKMKFLTVFKPSAQAPMYPLKRGVRCLFSLLLQQGKKSIEI